MTLKFQSQHWTFVVSIESSITTIYLNQPCTNVIILRLTRFNPAEASASDVLWKSDDLFAASTPRGPKKIGVPKLESILYSPKNVIIF